MFEVRAYYQLDDVEELQSKDLLITEAVGIKPEWSGCGVSCDNFGNRDLGWQTLTFEEAKRIKDAIDSVGFARGRLREK